MRYSVEKSDEIAKLMHDYKLMSEAEAASLTRLVEKRLESIFEFIEEEITELLTEQEFEDMDEWTVANEGEDVISWLASVKVIKEEQEL